MFQEALDTARANPEGDRWSEARSLVGLSTLESDEGDEEGSLRLAAEALVVAETSGDRFSIAVAHEAVGGTMRRMMRLEDAEPNLDAAVDAFRELGARWELASALTSRGIARRLAGRPEDAVKDLREAYRLCRELKERSIITWTAIAILGYERDEGSNKDVATRVWWISQVFGAEAAGGEEEVERARELLERTQMLQPFREAELVTSRSAISEA